MIHLSRSLRVLPVLLALGAPVFAQAPVVHINGQVWDGNGGPFVSGTVYHIISNGAGCCMSVPSGQTLTMQPGAMVKIDSAIYVAGTLDARGVVFTSWKDDSVGGDSNGDGGASSPARGDWSQIECGGAALFEDCNFFYGGSGRMTVHHRNGSMTMRRCVIEHGGGDGLELSALPSFVSDTAIEQCDGVAINGAALRTIQQLVDNTARDCDGGDHVRIVYGAIDISHGPVVLAHRHSLNGNGLFVLHSTTSAIEVRSGGNLTIPRGTVLKFERGRVVSYDDLQVQGTAAEPVVFTSVKDDAYGGDTNKDGNATQPAAGDWSGILLWAGSDASVVDHGIVRYGGLQGAEDAGVAIHGSSATVRDSSVEFSNRAGFYFRGSFSTGYPTVTDCTIDDNATTPFVNVPWQSLARAHGNTASGNAGGDHFVVSPERPPVPVTIGPANYVGPVLVVAAGTVLSGGGELTLLQGTQIKFTTPSQSGFTCSLNGALRALGTADEPVVLTSIHDDEVGGDTNRNGNATTPAPGDWDRVEIADTRVVSDSRLEHVVVRYAGRNGQVAVRAQNPRLSMRSVRVEHAAGRGIDVGVLSGDLVNTVVWDAGQSGIRISAAGSFDIVHATVVGCGGFGIEETNAGYSGAVRNSIAWNNSAGNFGGTLLASEVFASDGGFAGINGNISQAPLFGNESVGDLSLRVGSPCLGTADLAAALAVMRDHVEASRVLDHNAAANALPDMGAYERAAFRMTTAGVPELGAVMSFTVQGPPGFSAVYIGFLDGTFYLPSFGVQLAGAAIYFVAPSAVLVGQPIPLSIPSDSSLVGLRFGVQGVGLPAAAPGFGNFTNLHRATLR